MQNLKQQKYQRRKKVFDFNFEKRVSIGADAYEKIKCEIKIIYRVKESLDKELSFLFVEKISNFYKKLYALYDSYSLEFLLHFRGL